MGEGLERGEILLGRLSQRYAEIACVTEFPISTPLPIKRRHHQRLREVYRSAGWPSLDTLEIELLANGLLARVQTPSGLEVLRVTDAGIFELAAAHAGNVRARSAHEQLVEKVARHVADAGRIAWRGLSVLAKVPGVSAPLRSDVPSDELAPEPERVWVSACPDVFSIRNTTVPAYLAPIVHEIKVSRADLLGDLKKPSKRAAYLDMASECWYVLGTNAKGKVIGKAHEVPDECGVLILEEGVLNVVRTAPHRRMETLPFYLWMALAKATPSPREQAFVQGILGD